MLDIHLKSFLYRRGHTPYKALQRIKQAAYHIDPLIDEFFRDMEENCKALIQSGRNPSIEYLSLRTFKFAVNRDLEDESIKLPILGVKIQNADFDGKVVAAYQSNLVWKLCGIKQGPCDGNLNRRLMVIH